MDPKDFDVLLSDIDNNTVYFEIPDIVSVPNLEEAMKDETDKVAGELMVCSTKALSIASSNIVVELHGSCSYNCNLILFDPRPFARS